MKRTDIHRSALPGIADSQIPGAVRAGERVYLSGANALQPDGSVTGLGDAKAQAHAALDRLEAALASAGGSLKNLTKLTTCIVDREYRAAVYGAIAQRLPGVHPVSTGLVVPGLALPELIVQIDAEAAIPEKPVSRIRDYSFENWHGQGFAWQGSMVVTTDNEYFVRGQTGSHLDHSGSIAPGRRILDAGAQADLALANLKTLLTEAGASIEDVCKITVYISDRAYRAAVYPMIGKHFGSVRPVSTGIVTQAFARADILFEIDVVVIPRQGGAAHERLRPYNSNTAVYGQSGQRLDCEFCMAVVAGDRVILRGQTGMGLDHVMHGIGDAKAQAEKAMDNVAELLADAGATLNDVAKATVFVTERDYLEAVNAAVLSRFGADAPAFTTVIIKGLASPDLFMEVDITAVIGAGR